MLHVVIGTKFGYGYILDHLKNDSYIMCKLGGGSYTNGLEYQFSQPKHFHRKITNFERCLTGKNSPRYLNVYHHLQLLVSPNPFTNPSTAPSPQFL